MTYDPKHRFRGGTGKPEGSVVADKGAQITTGNQASRRRRMPNEKDCRNINVAPLGNGDRAGATLPSTFTAKERADALSTLVRMSEKRSLS